jgi:hypothetical protein
MYHDTDGSSRRYLHPDRLPLPEAVADFVSGLALGSLVGAARPIDDTTSAGPSRLRLLGQGSHGPHRTGSPQEENRGERQ